MIQLLIAFFNNNPERFDLDGDGFNHAVDLDDRDPTVGANVCGFTHNDFPNNGAFTRTSLDFQLVSPVAQNVIAGRPVDLTFEITNSDCDWAVVDMLEFSITSRGNSPWIEQVESDGVPMTLELPTERQSWEEVGYNVLLGGEQLFYQFTDGEYADPEWNWVTNLDAIWIAPGDSILVNFEFTESDTLPAGESFDIDLLTVIWLDVATATHISQDLPMDTMTVTID